jgi:site-specific recombinase XerD
MEVGQKEAIPMTKRSSRRKRCRVQTLTLPELDQSKAAVLNSLGSLQSRRSYRYAMEEFIQWYCSEPRLALNRSVVLRYRLQLEGAQLAPATINVRLAAIRRLAYEAADSGLLSPDLVAGIRRVKGVKRLGRRTGNWLSVQQGQLLLNVTDPSTPRGRRDAAMLALLLGCGLRRSELVALDISHFQQREEHWAIVDLVGKGGHVRTVPVPEWVKRAVDGWARAAGIGEGRLFRSIRKNGTLWGSGVTQNVVWYVVKGCAKRAGIDRLAPHDLRRSCARMCHVAGGELEQIQFLLGHASVQTTERYLGCKQRLSEAVNDRIGLGFLSRG